MSFISKRFFSTFKRAPLYKIDGQCHIKIDTSDTLVLKYKLELRQKWNIESQNEIKKDIGGLYEYPSPSPTLVVRERASSPEDSESALSHIMRMSKVESK